MTHFLEVDHHQIEYHWHGPPPNQATTLVFLHEGLGSVSMWKQFPQQLADAVGCGALVFSRTGYGASSACDLPRPLDFMQIEGCTVLPAILDALAVKSFILIGHSDGASIALIYAGNQPTEGLRGVIVEAPHLFVEELGLRSIEKAREAYLKGSLRQRLAPYHQTNVDTAFWGWNDAWLNSEFAKWNITQYVANIRVPILSLQGEQDPYGSKEQVDSIETVSPSEVQTVMLKNCAHTPHREQGRLTLETMSQFIQPKVL